MNVPTLETRLVQANQMLASKQAEHEPIAAAFLAAQSAFQRISADVATAQKQVAESKQAADAAQATLVAAQAEMDKSKSESDAAKQLADKLTQSTPMLKEAAEKALAASTQLPEDTTLKNAADMIQQIAQNKTVESETAAQDAAAKLTAMQTAQQAAAAAQSLATETASKLATAQQSELALVNMLKPAEETFNTAKQAFDQASSTLEAAKQQVGRWNDEIEFHRQLSELKRQRTETLATLVQQETSIKANEESMGSTNPYPQW